MIRRAAAAFAVVVLLAGCGQSTPTSQISVSPVPSPSEAPFEPASPIPVPTERETTAQPESDFTPQIAPPTTAQPESDTTTQPEPVTPAPTAAQSETEPTPTPTPLPTPDFEEPNPTPILDESAPVMYLTFDDGPHPVYTPQMLDVLARYGARATFFVVGSLVEAYPGTTQRIVDEGHTLGNHTWNHEALGGLTREEFDETVGRTQALLGDRGSSCLRPPYASMDGSTRGWAAEHGLTVVTWDTSPKDWLQVSAQDVAQHIVDYARDGVVMLLHDGGGDRSQTVIGLDIALRELSSRGYRFDPLCR